MKFLIILFCLLLCADWAFSEGASQRETISKNEVSRVQEQPSSPTTNNLSPAGITFAPIINVTAGKHANEPTYCGAPKNWREWSDFAWCRGWEWADAEKIIAIFTVILGIATAFLWWATRRLVKEAKETGQRQLRGYLSVTPASIAGTGNTEERFVQIVCTIKNHGQTPIRQINFVFDTDFFANPLADDFEYPPPSIPIAHEATLFPHAEMKNWFNFNRAVSVEQFNAIERDELRLHLWGTAFYVTAFNDKCETQFRASVGGANFVQSLRAVRRGQKDPGFNWAWEKGHGYGS